MLNRLIAVAPMLDWTDRHCRFFLRLLTRHTLLYTEMVTTGAVLRGDRQRFLSHAPAEHPLALNWAAAIRPSWPGAPALQPTSAMTK